MWFLLNAADQELHQVTLPPEAAPRLQHLLDTVRADLERSVSPALADELRQLTSWPAGARGLDELRVECVSLLGWTGGLVLAMLGQLEAAKNALDSPVPCRRHAQDRAGHHSHDPGAGQVPRSRRRKATTASVTRMSVVRMRAAR
jgi:hypothetical protein